VTPRLVPLVLLASCTPSLPTAPPADLAKSCASVVLAHNPDAGVVPCKDPRCPPATANACEVVCLSTGTAWGCCPWGALLDGGACGP